MKTLPKVVGLVQARNEWPLLALSISHALMHHVDEVYVLDHSSTDGTYEGTRRLQELWQDRVHVLNYDDDHFWQEACLSTLIEVSQSASPDWIYPFDADEFLMAQEDEPLKEVLGQVDSKYSVVRYEVQNWVSTKDFDDADLACYRMLRYRSVPNLFVDMYPETYVDEIRSGNLNFYDVPFESKVIFRNNEASWVAAGAHAIKAPAELHTLDVRSDAVRVGHLPFLSRGRLELKSRHGQLMVQDQFPASHGWQNQMIWSLSREGRLDEFWQSHSIATRSDSNDRTLPSFVVDDGLVRALEPVLCLLEDAFGSRVLQRSREQEVSPRESVYSQIPFRTAVHSSRKLQEIADLVRQERDALVTERDALVTERAALVTERAALVTERDALVTERDALVTERDALVTERDALVTERDALVTERAALVTERDALVTERDALVTERDALVTERDALVNSRSWRYTRFLRGVRARSRA